ncbi:UDP-N-acetylmuramate dehydrogenase [Corynebacterium rouxii]|uniref:UDP-N-acetylenolpyruvoylglucosamine reductase n=1 Tax=Corynebacterium rouxii TaxID=2719119 RepID=A0ABU3PK99_9CORY|nr:UDP-N-acetylmuramate dehydrogenase [Corynebacterium rouxii]MDT9408071.1 UDP-N-acetylmuramate dehydrogenase [Corynebacterium rouxii]MDT9410252.1 UDP-N-acetylmuramate dehydrogenase [Corynebacterium rouxii]
MLEKSLNHIFDGIRPQIEAIDGATFVAATFAELTTLHLGGTPMAAVRCRSQQSVVEVVRLLDAHQIPLLIVGGGSNLVIADGEIPLVAVILDCDDISVNLDTGRVVAEAGAIWDDVVRLCVDAGLGGIECLSGIPGSAGATPVQNVGAYGAEISDVLVSVTLLERATGEVMEVPAADLDLAYRYSNLKFTGRGVVLGITLQLHTDGMSAPLRFGELARVLGHEGPHPAAQVREVVLGLRAGKGMVYNEADHDTWSAGSFFTNPIVPESVGDHVRSVVGDESMPCFAVGEGMVKLSAAWLIDRAGFAKGHQGPGGRVSLSTKHTLALTNRGNATTDDLVALAREVRGGVMDAFGVLLEPEPVWVGVSI